MYLSMHREIFFFLASSGGNLKGISCEMLLILGVGMMLKTTLSLNCCSIIVLSLSSLGRSSCNSLFLGGLSVTNLAPMTRVVHRL